MRDFRSKRSLKARTFVLFIVLYLCFTSVLHMLCRYVERQDQIKAVYAAEATVRQVEAQLNRYLAESDLISRIVEEGRSFSFGDFEALSTLMQDKSGVIKAHELAKDGVVDRVWPLTGNEQAIGVDMLQHPQRRLDAQLAKESGQYTIAGPFELVQGGTGALLFDPIYQSGKFWGFSILVLDWDRFLEEVALSGLEETGYRYQIWKTSRSTGERIVIAQSERSDYTDAITVSCQVPNDTWYFEIEPVDGWVAPGVILFTMVISVIFSFMVSVGYWQTCMRRYREQEHARQIEQMARQAQAANEAKSRFLYNMSHDIRTPMNAIIGFSRLLETHIDDRAQALDYVAKLQTASSFLLSLINYVLEVSRIENGKISLKEETCVLPALLDELRDIFEPSLKEKSLSLEIRTDIRHPVIRCDTTKVREIFLNILSNSVKYTPDGGHISLTLTEQPCQKADCAAYTAVFTDDGIGMSSDYLPHIFEEFTREHTTTESKVVGTGLGLPIVKAFVDLMGGTIAVESEPGKGTTFTLGFVFPLAQAEQLPGADSPDGTSAADSNLQGRRVLLAEDNDLNAEIAITLLTEYGMQVDRAPDGAQCVEMLRRAPEGFYDVVLMDIQMPVMDGFAAARAIRAMDGQRGQVPIAAMTANAYEEDRQQALAAGMNDHIVKPLDLNVLLSTLHRLIR